MLCSGLFFAAAAAFSLGDVSAVAYDRTFADGKTDWRNWGYQGARDFAAVL